MCIFRWLNCLISQLECLVTLAVELIIDFFGLHFFWSRWVDINLTAFLLIRHLSSSKARLRLKRVELKAKSRWEWWTIQMWPLTVGMMNDSNGTPYSGNLFTHRFHSRGPPPKEVKINAFLSQHGKFKFDFLGWVPQSSIPLLLPKIQFLFVTKCWPGTWVWRVRVTPIRATQMRKMAATTLPT